MMKLMLHHNNWMSLNSPSSSVSSSSLSSSQDTNFISGSDHEDTTHSIYSMPSENWRSDSFALNGSSGDYSNMLFHSRGEFDGNRSMETNATTMFPSFGDEPMEYIFDRSDVRAVLLVLYTIVFCSCFFGNLMVILVVTLHWRMRSITNFCLANLAVADLCVGVFCVYQNIVTYLMDSWVFGEFMCKMYHFINSLSTTASVLILVVICIERYLAIIHPMTCKQMLTLNRLRITIVLVWILSAAISSPRFYYFSTISMPLPNDQYEILCLPNRTKYNSKLMDMISMTVLFLIPLTIITILYTHIGIVLWKSSKNRMPASSTPSASVESSTSSGCYYRETDHNIIQTVKLTLLPVAVSSQQQHQQQNLPHHHAPPTPHPTMSATNFHGVNSASPPSPHFRGSTFAAQQPEKVSSSLLPSPFLCLQCRNKSKRKHRRRSLSKLGRSRRSMYNGNNATPSPVGSRACKNYMANVAMNGNATTAVLMADASTAGGVVGQELVINCKACHHPYAHYQQNQPYYHSAGMIIPPSSADEAVETTSFIQCCHNHQENRPCVTPASNSRNNVATENWQACSAATRRSEATSSPNLTTCCGGRQAIKRPRNICLRRQSSPDKSVTLGAANTSPPSPFCNRNGSCMAEEKSANTEPIVLVKFENKKKQSSKKGSRKSQCTILMNTKRCQGSGGDFGSSIGGGGGGGSGSNAPACNGSRSGICGGGGSVDDGEGVDAGDRTESPQTMPPSPPRFDCAICHPQSIECCGESGVKGNDNLITGNTGGSSSGINIGAENGSLRRGLHYHHHRHHQHHPHNNSFQKNFSFEHKRNLSTDSGISGMPATTGRNNIEGISSCDQNIDGYYLPGVCGALCPCCGTSCGESHQLSRCHHHNHPIQRQAHNNFVSSSGSQKLSHFTTSNGGSGLPGVAVAAPTAPKRIRRMRVIRSSKYGTSALLSRRRIIRMLIVVVLAFALCHLPFHARKVWQYWSPKWAQYQAGSVFSTLFTPITFLIMYANSAINPILYAFMSKKFRMSFKDLLRCKVRHSLRMNRNPSLRSTHVVALSSQTAL